MIRGTQWQYPVASVKTRDFITFFLQEGTCAHPWIKLQGSTRAGDFTLTVPLSTQVYKWVPAHLMLGVTLQWTGIPSREE